MDDAKAMDKAESERDVDGTRGRQGLEEMYRSVNGLLIHGTRDSSMTFPQSNPLSNSIDTLNINTHSVCKHPVCNEVFSNNEYNINLFD